jgi:kelch-like protein 10
MMTEKDREILTPELARPRISPEILFCFVGNRDGNPTNFVEAYDVRADRWVKVSSTEI